MKYLYLLFLLINYINSHSWIDKLECVDNNNIGYIRNYQDRNNIKDFDIYMTYLLENRNINDKICSKYQQNNIYNINYPKLICPAGSKVKITYNTNGHVITDKCIINDPRGCKLNNFTADTYWSIHINNNIYPQQLNLVKDINIKPLFNNDSYLINYISKHNKFNFNNSCENYSSEICIGEFILPNTLIPNIEYQFIWYWILDRNYLANGEAYTSCFDIYVTPSIQKIC